MVHLPPCLEAEQVQVAHWDKRSVCLRRVINGLKLQGTEYKDARILFYGAGSSAVGVALAIETMMQTNGGLSKEEAQQVGPLAVSLLPCWPRCMPATGGHAASSVAPGTAAPQCSCTQIMPANLVSCSILNIDAFRLFAAHLGHRQ